MTSTEERTRAWVEEARQKLRNGGISEADLDDLISAIQQPAALQRQLRQRLLYLHANGMSVLSRVIAMDLREPTRKPNRARLSPAPEFPYDTVHEAIVDGWRVVQFPSQSAPIDDREINLLGYEFILEKLEEFDD
jgi:hypothetical protein